MRLFTLVAFLGIKTFVLLGAVDSLPSKKISFLIKEDVDQTFWVRTKHLLSYKNEAERKILDKANILYTILLPMNDHLSYMEWKKFCLLGWISKEG